MNTDTEGTHGNTEGWQAALQEAWTAYCMGSYAIGACVVSSKGKVLARGRNRLGEPRRAEGGCISGHDLAHAEINALLALADTPRPEVYSWTVLSTVEPCPQCAGAIAMSSIRAVEYAAPDPWAGCTRILTNDPYISGKKIRVGRAPEHVQRAALRLVWVSFFEGHNRPGDQLHRAFDEHASDLEYAWQLHQAGTLARLRSEKATFEQAHYILAI